MLAAVAPAVARPIVRLLHDSDSLAAPLGDDRTIDAETELRCGYCRTLVPACDLAASAYDSEVSIVVCFECVSSKRTNNLRYSQSAKGRLSIARSRRTKRSAQRVAESARKRERRRRAREAHAAAEEPVWAARLEGLFADDSDGGQG